jgi:uncharacterized DUF497 family protein
MLELQRLPARVMFLVNVLFLSKAEFSNTISIQCCPLSIKNSVAVRKDKNYTVVMTMRFEWDPKKAASNEKKHGVSFEEARTVFFDENAKLIDDPDHSKDEERFVLLGISSTLRVMVVCHGYREQGNLIRIISARKASAHESKQYR